MNERILKLMAEAGFDVEKLRTYPGGWPREDLLVLEDFAKLIVRECMSKTAGYLLEDEFGGSDVKEASEELAKHFGVE
jgi:hypothetical protein